MTEGPHLSAKDAAIHAFTKCDRLEAINADLLEALEALQILGEQGMEPEYGEWLAFHDKMAQIARAAITKTRGPQATSSYLNKPLRTVEQAVRDSES